MENIQNNSPILNLAKSLYEGGHRIKKTGGLVNPDKRLVAAEIATQNNVSVTAANKAVHLVHCWCVGAVPVGQISIL